MVMEEKKEKSARRNDRPRKREEDDGFIKKLIQVNRVSKTVKGGRNMRFAALVVVGDGNGSIGYGMGKSKEVPEAIEKATAQAKKSLKKVNLQGTSIPHGVVGVYGRGSVLMMPAAAGTGVIAGGPPCGYGSRRRKGYPYQIPRHKQPHQLRKSGCGGIGCAQIARRGCLCER